LRPFEDTVKRFFNFEDPKARSRMLRYFWFISFFMLVLGYLLIVLFLFR
jgi:hypothetical protein